MLDIVVILISNSGSHGGFGTLHLLTRPHKGFGDPLPKNLGLYKAEGGEVRTKTISC